MSDSVQDVVTSSMRAMQEEMLNHIESLIDSKMSSVQNEINVLQKELSKQQIEKINDIRYQNSYAFKKKGNEEQFKVNLKIKEKMLSAKAKLISEVLFWFNIIKLVSKNSKRFACKHKTRSFKLFYSIESQSINQNLKGFHSSFFVKIRLIK